MVPELRRRVDRSERVTDWQARIERIVAQGKAGQASVALPRRNGKTHGPPFDGSDGYPPDRREHPLAGCRRRHSKGEECLPGCSCPCHEKWVDMGPPVKTAEHLADAIRRGREHAAAELDSMPVDDGTITVSVPDPAKIDRVHFKLCLTCGWRRGPGGRCTC